MPYGGVWFAELGQDGATRVTLANMDDTESDSTRERLLAMVRAAGKVWARRQHSADQAMVVLRAAICQAAESGASITDIAGAAGTSRKAVYRALLPRRG